MQKLLVGVSVVTTLMTTLLTAQSPTAAVRLHLSPDSQLSFEGTSTLHDFTCTTKTMQAYIDVPSVYRTVDLSTLLHPIVGVQVVIPVKSLSCGGKLEGNMQKTLNATQYPYIVYQFSTSNIVPGSASATNLTVETHGQLTVSGKEVPIVMLVNITRGTDGLVTATGEQHLKMRDFGISPPTFMLGTLRVGNELKVRFTLKATSE
jgi:hypothetical protein